MKTKEIPEREASMWEPTTNKHDLAVLGKLAEEASELANIAARCIIQGIDGVNPDTNVTNREALENEIADVLATAAKARDVFALDKSHIDDRYYKKIKFRAPWFTYLKENP